MMGIDHQKRQMVLAVALAVVAALGLAATVTYGFSSSTVSTTATTTSNTTIGIDCINTNPPTLNLPPNSTLKEDGTTMIGGTSYWLVSFIKGNLTTVYFHGVQFAFNTFFGPTSEGSITRLNGIGLYTKNWSSTGSPGCGYFLPQITIIFPDGTSVVYNRETITLTAVGADINFDMPSSNPWFTQHVSPQAGVGYQTNGGEITLYVSTS